jgi:hypothetical protein
VENCFLILSSPRSLSSSAGGFHESQFDDFAFQDRIERIHENGARSYLDYKIVPTDRVLFLYEWDAIVSTTCEGPTITLTFADNAAALRFSDALKSDLGDANELLTTHPAYLTVCSFFLFSSLHMLTPLLSFSTLSLAFSSQSDGSQRFSCGTTQLTRKIGAVAQIGNQGSFVRARRSHLFFHLTLFSFLFFLLLLVLISTAHASFREVYPDGDYQLHMDDVISGGRDPEISRHFMKPESHPSFKWAKKRATVQSLAEDKGVRLFRGPREHLIGRMHEEGIGDFFNSIGNRFLLLALFVISFVLLSRTSFILVS